METHTIKTPDPKKPNIYRPSLMQVLEVIPETPDVTTFRIAFIDENEKKNFSFKAGQFGEYSIFGVGEATFCIASSPLEMDFIEFSVKRVGHVTKAIHRLVEGDIIGFRGPYGNYFPIDEWHGKNIVIVGGGIGLAPLRPVIKEILAKRDKFGDITIVYGARSPADLCFKYDLKTWEEDKSIRFVVTVDKGDEKWSGREGLVPMVLEDANPSPNNAIAVTCGPPIMIKFTLISLTKLHFTPEQIYTTLEMKMKCGLGKCGRCNIGPIYVCKHGPVFTYEQIRRFPREF